MAKAKKKLLPKDFEEQLEKNNFSDLIAVFDQCDINARGGYRKKTALAFDNCPDELAKWLVENGADLEAPDTYGSTPLQDRSYSFHGRIQSLIDLGADIHNNSGSFGTPLHCAAASQNAKYANILIANGAQVNAFNREQDTPLELALRRCANTSIQEMAELAQVLLAAGATITTTMKESVAEIGKQFEFHRAGYNKDSLAAADTGLAKLYELFQVPAIPQRRIHDGKSAISVTATKWQKQHPELWELLVPSSGKAATVQGEVIRISGRVANEIEGNGGANWDKDFTKMANALVKHLGTGSPVSTAELEELTNIAGSLKNNNGDTARMAELAVQWVLQNPTPIKLEKPDYKR